MESDIDSEYLSTVESGDMDTAQKMVDERAEEMGAYSFDEEYPTYSSMINGVKNGELLVHCRRLKKEEIPDLKLYGLYPTWGETVSDTESSWEAEEYGIPSVELIFASDDFKWAGDGRNGMIFIKKDEFQKSLGQGKVELPDGSVVWYERSPIADYEDPALRSEPIGVETGDWYTNESVEVVGLSLFNEKSADPVTKDDQGNIIPLSQRFDTSTEDIRY